VKRYALYMGCTPQSGEKELLKSLDTISPKLGIEFDRITEGSCCGGAHLQDVNYEETLILNARNLAYGEMRSEDIVTVCSTCNIMLLEAKQLLDNDFSLRDTVNNKLAEYGIQYTGNSAVRHILDVIADDIGAEAIRGQVVKPLSRLKIAPYYGCHIFRPGRLYKDSTRSLDSQNPQAMESIITAAGAEPIRFEHKDACCGFHTSLYDIPTSGMLISNILDEARRKGADAVITPCPLCHMNLDQLQDKAKKYGKRSVHMPVLHFEQLIGLAFGIKPSQLGLKRHLSPIKFRRTFRRVMS